MPPQAATEVAVAALTDLPEPAVLVELAVLGLLLPQPAANTRPLTARAAAAIVLLLLGTDPPPECVASGPHVRAPMARTGGIVPVGIDG